jgi:hypothetical protein
MVENCRLLNKVLKGGARVPAKYTGPIACGICVFLPTLKRISSKKQFTIRIRFFVSGNFIIFDFMAWLLSVLANNLPE